MKSKNTVLHNFQKLNNWTVQEVESWILKDSEDNSNTYKKMDAVVEK